MNYVKVINFIKKRFVLVSAIILILMLFIFHFITIRMAETKSDKLSGDKNILTLKDTSINSEKTVVIYDKVSNARYIVNPKKNEDKYTLNRIFNQLKIIRKRADSHDKTIDFFIANLYYFIILQTIFMIVCLILGLIISKKGWGDSSDNLLATFLICTGILLFSKIIPLGLKMDENLSSNKEHYKMYANMDNQIQTYLSTSIIDSSFTNTIDNELKVIHIIAFDLQQIPYAEVQKQFEEIKESAKGTTENK